MQHVHHRNDLVGHPQQYTHVVAVNELLEVGVEVELLLLIRRSGHLARQRDHLEQRADLVREDQRHIALCLALGADDHADILGVGGFGHDAEGERRTINQLTRSGQADGNDIIAFLDICTFCGGQQIPRRRCKRRGNGHAQRQKDGEQQRDHPFGLHRADLLFAFQRLRSCGGKLPAGPKIALDQLYFTASCPLGQ